MKNSIRFFIVLFFFTSTLFAQKDFTLKQVILERESLYPLRLNQLQWIPGTDDFSYVFEDDNGENIIKENYEVEGKQNIISLVRLNNDLQAAGFPVVKRFPQFKWVDDETIRFWDRAVLLSYNLQTHKLKKLNEIPDNAVNADFNDPRKVAYTIDNNLYIALNSNQIQITDEEKGIVSGQIVSRNEYGINKGTFWSPTSNYLAFYQKDEREVTDYPLLNIDTKPATVKYIKYPMAGMTGEKVSVGVYNLKTKKTIWLETGEPKDKYLPGVTWSPDEKYIYIAELNRETNYMRLTKYDAMTGKLVKVILEETNDKYVEPMHGPIFFKNEPDIFIWYTRNDGWNHLYLYDAQGAKIKQLTNGNWEVTNFDGFSSSGINIFFTATEQSPIERHYYTMDLNMYEMKRITQEKGVHRVVRNAKGTKFLDVVTSLEVPYRVNVINRDGEKIRTVYTAENPLKDYRVGKTSIFTLKSKDGYDLYCRKILPPDFDSTKKYPALVYVYGGPHVQLITNSWLGGARLWLEYMAQKGYVVFTLDNRGSYNRGLAFEQVTYRHLGTNEIEDQIIGANYLKSLSYIDSTRLGVFGWSFGGFMATGLMVRAPGVYKVGVAGGAVIDWRYYEIMYTERYMDTPAENPDGYNEASLLNYVKNLKGKLLLVHGTSDPTVVWQHTLLFDQKAMHLGIDLDYFPYVDHKHGIVGKDAYQLYLKITNYFNEHL